MEADVATLFAEQVTVNMLVQNLVYASGTVGAIFVVIGLLLIDVGAVRRKNRFNTVVEKMIGFVRSASSFTEQPKVIDGASDLLVQIFGDDGRHARTATGVAQLPFGAAVQLEMIMRLRSE